jgi:CheY-like chemotaxis protein
MPLHPAGRYIRRRKGGAGGSLSLHESPTASSDGRPESKKTMADKYIRADGLRDHASGAGPIRLLVVDCQPAVRRGLKMRLGLEEDLEVVGEAGDADGAIPLARALRPDVVLSDVGMPGGIATTEALRAAPHGAVVVFTLCDDSAARERAGEAGVAAFVVRRWSRGVLLAAAAASGGTKRKERGDDGARVAAPLPDDVHAATRFGRRRGPARAPSGQKVGRAWTSKRGSGVARR